MNPLSPHDLIATLGAPAMFLVLFAETGLLLGFFLPGDSLLFTAGILTTTGAEGLHLSLASVLSAAGAVAGAHVGYVLGRRAGPRLLSPHERPRLARAAARAGTLLQSYGVGKAVVLARFVPLVRTVMNPLAGAAGVPLSRCTLWQIFGGAGWTTGVVLAGHLLGASVPSIDRYLLPVIVGVVAISLTPLGLEARRQRGRH